MRGDRIFNLALTVAKQQKFDRKKVFNLLIRSFNLGNNKAAYALGNWHIHGIYVKKDYKKAAEFFKFAAEKSHPEACFDLANSFESGKGAVKNKSKAFKYYLKAALLGERQSLVEVARCYLYGLGVAKNKELADLFLDRAEELGVKW